MAEAQEGPVQKGFEGKLGIFADVSDEGKSTVNIQLKPTLIFTAQKELVHFLSAIIAKVKLLKWFPLIEIKMK